MTDADLVALVRDADKDGQGGSVDRPGWRIQAPRRSTVGRIKDEATLWADAGKGASAGGWRELDGSEGSPRRA